MSIHQRELSGKKAFLTQQLQFRGSMLTLLNMVGIGFYGACRMGFPSNRFSSMVENLIGFVWLTIMNYSRPECRQRLFPGQQQCSATA